MPYKCLCSIQQNKPNPAMGIRPIFCFSSKYCSIHEILSHSSLFRYRKIVPPQSPKPQPLRIPQEIMDITETLPNNNPKIPAANIPKTAHAKHAKARNILLSCKIFHIIRYIKSASSDETKDSKSL